MRADRVKKMTQLASEAIIDEVADTPMGMMEMATAAVSVAVAASLAATDDKDKTREVISMMVETFLSSMGTEK